MTALAAKHAPFGPTALVTGASDGIGRAVALALARADFDLVITARRGQALEALAAQIRDETGRSVTAIAADLGTEPGLDTVREACEAHDIGLAVLSAGFGTTGPLVRSRLSVEQDMLAVNCAAVLSLSHLLASRMVARGAGQLVLFGSIVGFQGNGGTANYSATKAWVQTFAEGLAAELAPSGVKVLAVAPGPVATGFADRAGMTMSMAARPEEIARGILNAIGRSGTIRPGILAKLLGWNMAMAPRPLRVRLMTRIMGGMVRSNSATEAGD